MRKDPATHWPTYGTWLSMKKRCRNASCKDFPAYGGRGIRVCDRWSSSYEAFLEDMGPRPDGMTLDRIDSDGHYEPGNCRWATASTQRRNQRNGPTRIEFNGTSRTMNEWAMHIGISDIGLVVRIKKWGVERALTTPVGRSKRAKARGYYIAQRSKSVFEASIRVRKIKTYIGSFRTAEEAEKAAQLAIAKEDQP